MFIVSTVIAAVCRKVNGGCYAFKYDYITYYILIRITDYLNTFFVQTIESNEYNKITPPPPKKNVPKNYPQQNKITQQISKNVKQI